MEGEQERLRRIRGCGQVLAAGKTSKPGVYAVERQEFMVLRILRLLGGLFGSIESRLIGEFCERRVRLEQDYFELCSAAGKPRGLRWDRCDWLQEAVLLRERGTGHWWLLRGVNLSFQAIAGGDMEDVAAVGLLRDACAVYVYGPDGWRPSGRTLFNMDTVRAAVQLGETHEERRVFRTDGGA